MNLQNLVAFYNQLCSLTSADVQQLTNLELQKITQISQDPQLEILRLQLLSSFDQFENQLTLFKQQTLQQIQLLEQPCLQRSHNMYQQERSYRYNWFHMKLSNNLPNELDEQYQIREKNIKQHIDVMLNRQLDLSEHDRAHVLNRIKRHSSWKNTTMILRPGLEPWLPHMVSNEPMYLVDEHLDLLIPSMQKFNQQYQRRLRVWTITEDQPQPILNQLPDEQFGLVLAYNYFNYISLETVQQYLTELYQKLRPGGILLMTYNDCDRWRGVSAFESNAAAYTPGRHVQKFAHELGFESEYTWHNHGPWTWQEFRKPGQFESLRGGPAMAKIMPK
jgi:hypothetical protein